MHFLASADENHDKMYSEKLQQAALERSPSLEDLTALVEKSTAGRGVEYCTGAAGSVIVFDCNLMHGSHQNMTPFDRKSLFTVYNAVDNTLVAPFGSGKASERPEHLASRDRRWSGVALQGTPLAAGCSS